MQPWQSRFQTKKYRYVCAKAGNCTFAMATPRTPMKKGSIPAYTTVYKIAEGWLVREKL